MKNRIMGLLATSVVLFSTLVPFNADAASLPLDDLANKAKYHTEKTIVGYQDVEKQGLREVEKIGYNDIEVPIYEWDVTTPENQRSLAEDWTYKEYKDKYYVYPKNDYSQGRYESKEFNRLYPASRTETWTEEKQVKKQVPYKVKEPIYKTETISRVKQKTKAYSKANYKNKLTAKDKNLKTTDVYAPNKTVVKKVDKNWYKGNISYTSYKKTTIYNTNKQIKTDITHYNKSGKKVNVIISKGAKVTKKNDKYYTNVTYTPYKKVDGKWTKQKEVKKSQNVSSKNVSSKTENQKYTEKKTAYIPSKYVTTKKETKKIGEKTVTKYKTVVEYKQVPVVTKFIAWDIKIQVGTKIEKEPYTYKENETYTYTVKEPIYESKQVENTVAQTYKNAVDFYAQYELTQDELPQLLDKAGIAYRIENGYDKTRYVQGSVSAGGTTHYYSYTPNTLVQLLIFDDNSAINLSYLYEPYIGNGYGDVKISNGGYSIR
ncbi:hypothetical protein ACXM0N_09655 [Peribacillus simplex]